MCVWNIMGCYKFRVLYLQNYSSDCYETYRYELMSDRELKY